MPKPYLFQRVHTLHHKPIYLEVHLEVLARCYKELWGADVVIKKDNLAAKIEKLLKLRGAPYSTSTYIELRLDIDGTIRPIILENSIYEGYTLRCFNPKAYIVTYDNTLGNLPTSVRSAAADLALSKAQLHGADIAIREGSDGVLYSADDAPLFAVMGRNIYTPPAMESVEHRLVARAAQRHNITIQELSFKSADLHYFDELFYVNHYGVTAIHSYEKKLYMSIIARKISTLLM